MQNASTPDTGDIKEGQCHICMRVAVWASGKNIACWQTDSATFLLCGLEALQTTLRLSFLTFIMG